MKRLIPLTILLLIASGAKAQLRSVGDVPADLKMSVQELYEDDLKRAKKYSGGRVKNKQQVLEASYNINKMMAGGHIVYGDPISRMVERIADTLLADYPELRSELRFYTVTSPEVNAFATGQGMVFVNVGMVAQVDNEAQLAFVISHEIIHYYRSHSLEAIIGKKKKDKTSKADLEETAGEMDDFIRRHNRSREMENEADSLGIALFYLKSPYYKGVTDGVFDVLQYSALPFDDLPFDTTYFNTPYYTLGGCWSDTVSSITSRDNYDDSRSTHPNIISRRRTCSAALDGYNGGEEYVVTTEAEFRALRQMARMECIRQEVIHGEYARAFYNTWVMRTDTTTSQSDCRTLDKLMAHELYGLAAFKNNELEKTAVGDYKQIEGESQQVHYAMKEMTPEQATLIALHKTWELHRLYPGDEQFSSMAADLMEMLRLKNNKSIIDFVAEPPKAASDTAEAAPGPSDNKPKTKYERIKQKREVQTKRNPTSYALTDLMVSDPTFTPELRAHLAGTAPKEAPLTVAHEDTAGVIIFNPSYWVINNHSDEFNVSKSDACETELTSRIINTAKRFDRQGVDFSDAGMHTMESDSQYNDFLSLCEWSNEFWLSKGDFAMVRLTQPAMNGLLDRYDARTVNYTAVLNVEGLHGDGSIGMLVFVPLAPVILSEMFTGIEHTAMASVIVDAREGKVLSRQSYSYNVADHSDLLDGAIHDTYVRAMRPKVKEPKGYLGNRLAIVGGYNFGLAGYQTFKYGHYTALTPWASIEFAIKRNRTVALWGRYHKAYEDVKAEVETSWQEQHGSYYVTHYGTQSVQSSKNMLMLGATWREYRRSDFAPLGLYFGMGLHMVRFTTLGGTHDGNTYGFHLGIGRNYIFFHRLVLNYDISYAYTYGFTKTLDFDFSGEYKKYLHYDDAILSNILTIRLGIGFLPF